MMFDNIEIHSPIPKKAPKLSRLCTTGWQDGQDESLFFIKGHTKPLQFVAEKPKVLTRPDNYRYLLDLPPPARMQWSQRLRFPILKNVSCHPGGDERICNLRPGGVDPTHLTVYRKSWFIFFKGIQQVTKNGDFFRHGDRKPGWVSSSCYLMLLFCQPFQ